MKLKNCLIHWGYYNMIPYGRQSINEEDIKAVVEVLKSDYLTTGPKVKEFEELFSRYVGSKYAVAVSSGTAALHIACLAANLKKGEELITSPMTFAASANCALYCDAKPIFVDINKSGLINEDAIESKISDKTKVIIPVHYSGRPVNMHKIQDIAKKRNLIVIEDACHALGASFNKSLIGNCEFSDMSVFSFHPVKHITTGEGGIITTNSKKLYEKLLLFRTHGITKSQNTMSKNEGPWFYEMIYLGFNYRITDIQCALGISQLSRIDDFVTRRKEIAQEYYEAFNNSNYFNCLIDFDKQISSYHLFPILLTDKYKNKRKEIFQMMRNAGLWIQVHYIPVYLHPFYQNLGYQDNLCPIAEDFYQREISIPMYASMSDIDVKFVINKIQEIFEKIEKSI